MNKEYLQEHNCLYLLIFIPWGHLLSVDLG